MMSAMCVIGCSQIDLFKFTNRFYAGRWVNMVHIGIDITKSTPTDELFPVKVSILIPELDMSFCWYSTPFLIKRHFVPYY